jgi:hypothetical protein
VNCRCVQPCLGRDGMGPVAFDGERGQESELITSPVWQDWPCSAAECVGERGDEIHRCCPDISVLSQYFGVVPNSWAARPHRQCARCSCGRHQLGQRPGDWDDRRIVGEKFATGTGKKTLGSIRCWRMPITVMGALGSPCPGCCVRAMRVRILRPITVRCTRGATGAGRGGGRRRSVPPGFWAGRRGRRRS